MVIQWCFAESCGHHGVAYIVRILGSYYLLLLRWVVDVLRFYAQVVHQHRRGGSRLLDHLLQIFPSSQPEGSLVGLLLDGFFHSWLLVGWFLVK